MTSNLREWHTILKLRCSKRTHLQMKQVMPKVFSILYKSLPVILFVD
ncbi:MAG: FAD-dependent thymidylate synthase [Selenomonadaceae bacterium]|nr:FAD-dependent thymidylate synthase [Selenomonadaceae bacterium]